MADNSVFITGATDGAFTDALKDLPPWATEKTAYKIQGILKKSLDVQQKTLAQMVKCCNDDKGKGGGNSTAQTNTELAKLVKLLAAQNAEENKGKKRRKAKEAEDAKSLFNLKSYNTSQKRTTLMLNGLAAASGKIIDGATDYIKIYDGLYKSGINVMNGNNTAASGMLALNQVVTLTGLRLQVLQKVAEKYSTSINALGFLKFAKATANAKDAMVELGYSSEETANLVGAYTDMQMYSTDMRRKSDQDITTDVKAFAKQVNYASSALGISREQVLANAKTMSESTGMAIINAKLGASAADNVRAQLIGLNPELASRFLSMVTSSASNLGMLNPHIQALISSTSRLAPEILQMTKDMANMSPEEVLDKWGSLVNDPKWKEELARMGTMQSLQVDGATATIEMMTMLQSQVHRVSEATKGQTGDATKTQAVIAALQTAQEKFASSMQSLFVPLEGQIQAVTTGFELLNKGVSVLTDNISASTRSTIGVGTVLATFVVGTLIPKLLSITSFFGLAGGAANVAASAGGAAAAAAAAAAATLASAAAAGAGGYFIGDTVVRPLIDSLVQAVTGVKDASLGTAIYDMMNTDGNAKKNTEISGPKNPAPDITKKNTEISIPKNPAPDITKKNTEISIPKNPAPSVINSPSAIPTNPAQSGMNAAEQAAAGPVSPVSPGIEKHSNNNEINSTMALQIGIMQQLLDKTATLVSVQQDMLQVARNR